MANLNLSLNMAQLLAATMGLKALPQTWGNPSKGVVDPVSFSFSITNGAISVGSEVVDITANEKTPAGIGTSIGAYKSKGQTNPYVGWVYGIAVVLDSCPSDDAIKVIRSYEAGVKSRGAYRVVPFSEALRIVPGRMLTTTAEDVATGCPSGKGSPQYPFPGQAIPWTGSADDQIFIRANYAGGTTATTVTGSIIIWGALAPGVEDDVINGTLPDLPCESQPSLSRVQQTILRLKSLERP